MVVLVSYAEIAGLCICRVQKEWLVTNLTLTRIPFERSFCHQIRLQNSWWGKILRSRSNSNFLEYLRGICLSARDVLYIFCNLFYVWVFFSFLFFCCFLTVANRLVYCLIYVKYQKQKPRYCHDHILWGREDKW